MANILIVVYLLIVLAMIIVILLQRSEGGALGMGSSNSGGFAPVRTSANLLTRTTAILGALFMATAIGLSIVNEIERGSNSILDNVVQTEMLMENGEMQEAPNSVLDALNALSPEASVPSNPVDVDAPNLPVPTTNNSAPAAPTNN